MKKTKLFTSALCLGAAALSLASCKGNQGGEQGGTTPTKDPQITFYCSAGNSIAPIIQAKIDAFNKTSDVDVKMVNPGNYDPLKEKVKADLKVNNQPAIAYCYPDHVAEYLTGTYKKKVIKINERFSDYETVTSKLVPTYLEEGKVYDSEGSIYSLPFQRSTECMYVNLDHLQAAGVTTEQLATWEDLFAVLPKIRAAVKDLPNVEGVTGSYNKVVGYDSEDNLFITLCHQYGIPYTAVGNSAAERYLFQNDKVKAMLTGLNAAYHDGVFTTQEILGGYTSNEFVKGNLTISIGSTGGANHQNPKEAFNYAVLPLPQPKDAKTNNALKTQSVSQGPSICMFEQKNDKLEDAAWKFVKEVLLTDDLQVEFSTKSGYLPVTTTALESEAFKTFCNGDSIMAKTINVAAAHKENLFQSPAFNGSNTARNQVGIALTEAVKSDKKGADLQALITQLLNDAFVECEYFE